MLAELDEDAAGIHDHIEDVISKIDPDHCNSSNHYGKAPMCLSTESVVMA
jgi:hypothetical protein